MLKHARLPGGDREAWRLSHCATAALEKMLGERILAVPRIAN